MNNNKLNEVMESKIFKFELTEEQIRVIEAGLKELPGKFCLPVLNSLLQQISEQGALDEKTEIKEITQVDTDDGSDSDSD